MAPPREALVGRARAAAGASVTFSRATQAVRCTKELPGAALLQLMLTVDPIVRATAAGVLQHPWVVEHCDPARGQVMRRLSYSTQRLQRCYI